MQSIYTIYYNSGEDVTPLRYCDGYTHAEELLEAVAADFMKLYKGDLPHRVVKYTEGDNVDTFSTKLYKDATFTQGVCFVKKKYEATMYEKICTVGTVYNTYSVKYLGRLGVMAQQYVTPTQQVQLIDGLRSQVLHKEQLLNQQDLQMKRQDSELRRLEKTIERTETETDRLNAIVDNYDRENTRLRKVEAEQASEIARIQVELTMRNVGVFENENPAELENFSSNCLPNSTIDSSEVPRVPAPPRPPTEFSIKKQSIAPVLDELKAKFAQIVEGNAMSLLSKKIANDDIAIDKLIAEIDQIGDLPFKKLKNE